LVGRHKDSTSSDTLVVRADDANAAEDSSGGVALSDLPLRIGCEWVSEQVIK